MSQLKVSECATQHTFALWFNELEFKAQRNSSTALTHLHKGRHDNYFSSWISYYYISRQTQFNTKLEGVQAIHLNAYDTHIIQFSNIRSPAITKCISQRAHFFYGSLVLGHFLMLKELRWLNNSEMQWWLVLIRCKTN